MFFEYNKDRSMEIQINKILAQIKGQQFHNDTLLVEKAFSFLLTKTQKQNYDTSFLKNLIKNIQNQTLRPILPDFISVLILYPLIEKNPELLENIKTEFGDNISKTAKAFQLAHQYLHNKQIQNRNLFEHTLNTTLLLAESNIGHESIIASLLKHLPELTPFSYDLISKEFDDSIVEIIKKTNSLKKLISFSRQQNTQKQMQTFLAMAKDYRVVLIKICSIIDLLKNHNEINEKHHKRIALEAINIYAPIADVFGSWSLKWKLEDYAFKILNPNEFQKIENKFQVAEKKNREKYIEKTKQILIAEAKKYNIDCVIDGRFKHFYSIYSKMKKKKKSFNEVYDVFALRVIVNSVDDCYRLLGIIHQLWKPKPRRIKDYIARPKPNQYQSLHTTVYGLNNRMTEFQIRTKEMNEQAKFGIASHWNYKNNFEQKPNWIKSLFTEKKQHLNQADFYDQINSKLVQDRIFIYTPKGDILSLPKNSTPIDFAYQIHTSIGDQCAKAIVNNQEVPLDYKLQNGDAIQIITDPKQHKPKKEWLNSVSTSLAKKQITSSYENNEEND